MISFRLIDLVYFLSQSLNSELSECKSLVSRLRGEIDEKDRSIKEKDRAVVQLRRELIDVDSQLDSERRRHASILRAADKSHQEDATETAEAAGESRPDSSLRRHRMIPSADSDKVPRPPPPSAGGEEKPLSDTFADMSPPPKPRPSASRQDPSGQTRAAPSHRTYPLSSTEGGAATATGTSRDRRHLSPYAHPIGGASQTQTRASKSPSRTAPYAATTASFRSGRQSVESSGPGDGNVSRASSRMRTVRASSSISAHSGGASHSHNLEHSSSELFERHPARPGRVPEWRSMDEQGTGATRDISPVFPRRGAGQNRS